MSLLKKIFGGESEGGAATAANSPALVYAVGDVHGRLDLMEQLIEIIRQDAETFDGEKANLIFLGDLIDRGPQSAGCVERVLALRNDSWCTPLALMGNHEQAMLRFLDDAAQGELWVQYGGGSTLKSYGVQPPVAQAPLEDWERARTELAAATPETHQAFLREMPLWAHSGDYVFVHAGVRPGVPLEEQTRHDLLWIRGEFLSSKRASDKVVVHGHTPTQSPDNKRWRIGIDTGAYASGVLTAVRLKARKRAIFHT